MTKSIIASSYYDLNFSKKILYDLLDEQHDDGGWGINGKSSHLESSYCIITILYWLKMQKDESGLEFWNCLKKAANFMECDEQTDKQQFWIDKTLYSIVNVDEISVLCAKYALKKAYFY